MRYKRYKYSVKRIRPRGRTMTSVGNSLGMQNIRAQREISRKNRNSGI